MSTYDKKFHALMIELGKTVPPTATLMERAQAIYNASRAQAFKEAAERFYTSNVVDDFFWKLKPDDTLSTHRERKMALAKIILALAEKKEGES